VNRIGEAERLATVKVTRPAPNRLGETTTLFESTLALTSMGAGGRGSFGKSFEPQAPSDPAPAP
jgi:hypothetical protein